ncbi:hypothetical protein J2S74_000861 [Evansella vedderi]|uniref:Uncharacterized protein n=1 Tax=Evansella vedderi TaxID=38282 RepID=A0ABT9ZQL0_9BACI|nr:hypothetical protein [Evansella vedderi]MDQ0253489.1 hypothetical protein [Evansella vedderi]
MGQHIGNVGILNLVNATEESVEGVESIGNVGMLLYGKETAHLVSKLNIGNIGKTIELPEDYRFYNGNLIIDQAYLDTIQDSIRLLVNGTVIIDKEVQPDQLQKGKISLIVNGSVYAPAHLSAAVGNILAEGGMKVDHYEGPQPRFESGEVTLSNAFLDALEDSQCLVISGVLRLAQDLDLKKFDEKISKLKLKGLVTLFENQESIFYKKAVSVNSKLVKVIPDGYEVLTKTLRLNSRSIRRFKNKKLYTKKPLILEGDVTREMLTNAITKLESTSFVICHETLEDLVYEIASNLDTEILSYKNSFVMVEGEDTWSNDEFLALENPTNFIVQGQLTLEGDVQGDVLSEKIAALDILGEVIVSEKKLKGSLQNVIRVNTGRIKDLGIRDGRMPQSLKNVGELSL